VKGEIMAKGKYKDWLTEEGLLKIEGWARDGLIDKQIASNIGVSERTFTDWKKNHSAISSVLKKGKEVVDIQVENALLKRAMGFDYVETTEELTKEGMSVTKKVTKTVAPDTTAAIFWLKNRKPKEWRDKKETELSGGVAVNPFTNLTEEELRKLANQNE
jgi:hypothetical protein